MNKHRELRVLHRDQDEAWRSPAEVGSQWQKASSIGPESLRFTCSGDWKSILQKLNITLLISREYEHFVMAVCVRSGRLESSFWPVPHPSGMAIDRRSGSVFIASTRNPNQIFELRPVSTESALKPAPLLPIRSEFYPGSLYLHDLAFIGGKLHASSTGTNSIIRFDQRGGFRPVWSPRCVSRRADRSFQQNYIQLNSIAAGPDLTHSYFSASTDQIGFRRPGHRQFAVDGHGVVFSGRTGTPVARGLTRPHSARLYRGRLWVDNSGYGQFGYLEKGHFRRVASLPGWTRGLCFKGRVAFVATSRILPRFRAYAPGLKPSECVCGVHAVDVITGRVLGSIRWPMGNQIFAVEWIASTTTRGFPFDGTRRNLEREKKLFYSFKR